MGKRLETKRLTPTVINIAYIALTGCMWAVVVRKAGGACDFEATSCTCSYSAPRGPCYAPLPDGGCETTRCPVSWRCDCATATHLCTRSTCVEYGPTVAATLAPGLDARCHSVPRRKCLRSVGQPIRPISVLPPSPTPTLTSAPTATPSASPFDASAFKGIGDVCDLGSECRPIGWDGSACILGYCRSLGTCSPDMSAYCASLRTGSSCCPANAPCPLTYFEGDTAICSTDCSADCMRGGYTDCAFRIGGASVVYIDEGPTITWRVDGCPVMT